MRSLTISIFFLKENKGPAFCRNYGIQKSESDYLAFMDSDDFWPKNKLEKQLNEMLKNDYSFTYTNYYYFYRDNEKTLN